MTTKSFSEIDVDQLDIATLDSDLLLIGSGGAHHVLVATQHPVGDLVVRVSGEQVTLSSAFVVTAPNRRQWVVGTAASALWAALVCDPTPAPVHP
jgi:hypothetical protein